MCEQGQTARSYIGPGAALALAHRLHYSQRRVTLVCDQLSYQAVIWPTSPIRAPPILGRCCAESGICPSGLVCAPPPSLSHLTRARVCPAHKNNRQTSEAHLQNDHWHLQELPHGHDGAPSQHPTSAAPAGQHLVGNGHSRYKCGYLHGPTECRVTYLSCLTLTTSTAEVHLTYLTCTTQFNITLY